MNKIKTIVTAAIIAIATFSFSFGCAVAQDVATQKLSFTDMHTAIMEEVFIRGLVPGTRVLVIGASYENGGSPLGYDSEPVGPLGGFTVNFGRYTSLGDALQHYLGRAGGGVINGAQGGATTFSREGGWLGYEQQFAYVLARARPFPEDQPQPPLPKYILISGTPNDCLHSHAFVVSPGETERCTVSEMKSVADRIVKVAKQAIELGITPIFTLLPPWEEVNTDIATAAFDFGWMITEKEYRQYSDILLDAFKNNVPSALVVDAWSDFEHLGDGLHPKPDVAYGAARKILTEVKKHQQTH